LALESGGIEMTTRITWPRLFCAAVASLTLAATSGTAQNHRSEPVELDVAEIFFELNDTDGDLGTHALIDGDPWKRLRILDPNGRSMLNVGVQGRLGQQGLTELFFESAEPNFDELSPETFFDRFPEGSYRVTGRTLDRKGLSGETELTHVIPAPPEFTVNGEGAEPEGDAECEEENLPEISNPVVIEWDAVTESHSELGEQGAEIEIIRYQVVAEWEDEDENAFTTSIDIQPEDGVDAYSVRIPEDFFVDGIEVKFEVLAREESFNQTAVESCPFEFVDD
jgi:hypothetical protein